MFFSFFLKKCWFHKILLGKVVMKFICYFRPAFLFHWWALRGYSVVPKSKKNNDNSWKILQILNIFNNFDRSLRKYNATATIVFLGSWRKTFQGLRINTKGKNFWPNPLENHIKLILFQHSSLEKNEFTLIYVFSKILNLMFLRAEKSTKYS